MVTPLPNQTPPVGAYNFAQFVPQESLQVSHPEIEEMKQRIGRKILPLQDGQWTPKEKSRAVAITLLVLSSILTVGAILAAAFSGVGLLLLATIPTLVGVGFSIAYLVTQGKDLQNRKVRERSMQEIASSSFQDILRSYSVDDVIGFKLLDRIRPETHDADFDTRRALFYRQFEKLAQAHARMEGIAEENRHRANRKWESGTADLRCWWEREKDGVVARNISADFLASAVHSNHPHCRCRRCRGPSFGDVAVEFYRQGVHAEGQAHMNSVNFSYDVLVAPWNTWRSLEHRSINGAQSYAEAETSRLYSQMKNS